MPRRDRKALLINLVIPLAVGLAAGLYLHRNGTSRWIVTAADVLFSMGSAVLIWGIVRELGNVHMFTSASYGFHRFHDLLRGKQMKGSEMKEDYVTYRQSRPHHSEAVPLIIIGAVLLGVSVAVSLMAVA